MTEKERIRRQIARVALIQSWRYKKRNPYAIDLSLALTIGWAVTRSRAFIRHTKAHGVTFEGRQQYLKSISQISYHRVTLRLQQEKNNPYDVNAVKIIAAVDGIRRACIGYLPRELAAKISAELSAGKRCVAFYNGITGGEFGKNYGLNLSYVLIGRD